MTLTRDRNPLVPCTYPEGRGGLANEYGSCGAMIPYGPRRPCPECGQRQLRNTVIRPPDGARVLPYNDTIIHDADTGRVAAVYAVGARDLAARWARACRTLRWDAPITDDTSANEARLSGLVVSHRVFGTSKPQALRRRHGCGRSHLDADRPDIEALSREFVTLAAAAWKHAAPLECIDATALVREAIRPRWLIADTPFTSGIINNTAALPYHRDAGNVPGSWSAMLGCRRGVEGGWLHLVDYDVYVPVDDGSITLFDGQSVLHGVTPMRVTGGNAYRYTMVAYAVAAIGSCVDTPEEELRRAQQRSTAADDRRRRVPG